MADGDIAKRIKEITSKMQKVKCPTWKCKHCFSEDNDGWPDCNVKYVDGKKFIMSIGYDEIDCPYYEPKEE